MQIDRGITRWFIATSALVTIACSGDLAGPTNESLDRRALDQSLGKNDTSVVVAAGREWRLETIRGVVRGTAVLNTTWLGDTTSAGPAVGNAVIEVHKIGLSQTSDPMKLATSDLGVVATVTADALGRFEYKIAEPLIVRSNAPSPMMTYHLTIKPPASSAYASRSAVQVFFAEQTPSGNWNYYVALK